MSKKHRQAEALERNRILPCGDNGNPVKDAATELRRLHAVNQALLQELNSIATTDWRSWDRESRSPATFVTWAQSRARQAIALAGGEQPC